MLERSMTAFADSMSAMSRIGEVLAVGDVPVAEVGCRSGRVCRTTSVTKCRSDAEFTLGMTIASIFGALSYGNLAG